MKTLKNKALAALLLVLAIVPIVIFPGEDCTGSVFLAIIALPLLFAKDNKKERP